MTLKIRHGNGAGAKETAATGSYGNQKSGRQRNLEAHPPGRINKPKEHLYPQPIQWGSPGKL